MPLEMIRSPLIDGWESFMSVEEIRPRREEAECWMDIGGVLAKGDRQIVLVTVTLGKYTHLDHEGVLTFTLFFDRLQNTKFYPSDLEEYQERLKQKGTDLQAASLIFLPPFTVVSQGQEKSGLYKGKAFICWSDKRLDEEAKNWLRKNR